MTSLKNVAVDIVRLERRMSRLERTGSLTYSSIDDGALDVTDGEGTVTMQIGKQFDSTYAVAPLVGPPPPQPTDAVCEPQLSAVNVTWDGLFAGGALAPMDFARVEVHASPDIDNQADTADTLIGTFETPRGGTQVFPVPTPGTNYVRLVARSQSGKSSTPSNPVAVTPITGDDITADVLSIANAANDAATAAQTAATAAVTAANGKNKNYYQATPPTGGTYVDGDLWFDTDDGNKPYQWQGGAWVSVQDAMIATAISASGAALTAANAAQVTADGKNRIYYQTTAPTGGTYVVGDLWFDTDDGNKPYRWDGAAWTVSVITATLVGPNAVTVGTIATGAVTTNTLAAGAVTANKLNVVVGGGNLVADSSFELSTALNTTSGWVVNGGGVTGVKDTAQKFLGAQSFKFTPAGVENYGYFPPDGATNGSGSGAVVRPASIVGATYSASIYVFTDTAQSLALYNYGTPNVAGPTVAVPANTWTRLTLTYVAGATNFISVRVPGRATAVLGNLWLDAFQIELGDVPTAYSPKTDEILPGTINATMMQAGTITATSGVIANLAITNTMIATGIDATKITVGTLSANLIGSHTITSDKIIVSSLDNLLYDPTFDAPLGTSWEAPSYAVIDPTGSRSGGKALKVTLTSADQTIFNLPLDVTKVEAGWGFRVSINFKATVPVPDSGVNLVLRVKDTTGTIVQTSGVGSDATDANTWASTSQIVTVPTGGVVVSAYLEFPATFASGTVWIDTPSMNRAADGSLIVDGQITADKISAHTITADEMDPTYLKAGFVLAGQITVGAITITPTGGVQIPQPDGGVISFPADGTAATITADLIALSLQVKNGLQVSGQGSIQGEIVLNNGISQPASPPTVSAVWYGSDGGSLTTLPDGGIPGTLDPIAVTDHPTDSTLMVQVATFQHIRFGPCTGIRYIDKATLSVNSDVSTYISVAFNGWVRAGTLYYTIAQESNGNFYWYTLNQSTGFARVQRTLIGNAYTFHSGKPSLVTDGTLVGMVWVPLDGNLYLRWHNPGSWTPVGTDKTLLSGAAAPGDYNLVGDTYLGAADTGSTRLWVGMQNWTDSPNVFSWTYNTSTNGVTRDTTQDFPLAYGSSQNGLIYEPTQGRFMTVGDAWWTYSKIQSTTVNAQYTWYDGDSAAYPAGTVINGIDVSGTPSGTHESLPSQVTTKTMPRRSWPSISCSPAPDVSDTDPSDLHVDKANRIGLYVSVGGGTLFRYGYLAVGVRSVSAFDTLPTSGTAPTTNGFLTAANAPGKISSSALRLDGQPKNYIDGSGAARMDGLLPPGSINMYAGSVAPSGWLLCQGQALPRSGAYADLFNAIGTAYGAGDGSTTFNVPDLRSRLPFGVGGAAVRGQTELGAGVVGADDATRQARTDHTHDHGSGTLVNSATDLNLNTNTTTGGTANRLTQAAPHAHNITGRVASGGPSQHAFTAVNFIIKT
jgi:microcystin-dependent protein